MNIFMNRVTAETISFFDSGSRPSDKSQPERFWHGFVLGLVEGLRDEGYEVTSNRESGFGRYDVMLAPVDIKDRDKYAYIIEFKVQDHKAGEETLQKTADAALRQIITKDYDRLLLARGVSPYRIVHYGFAFCGKEVLILQG